MSRIPSERPQQAVTADGYDSDESQVVPATVRTAHITDRRRSQTLAMKRSKRNGPYASGSSYACGGSYASSDSGYSSWTASTPSNVKSSVFLTSKDGYVPHDQQQPAFTAVYPAAEDSQQSARDERYQFLGEQDLANTQDDLKSLEGKFGHEGTTRHSLDRYTAEFDRKTPLRKAEGSQCGQTVQCTGCNNPDCPDPIKPSGVYEERPIFTAPHTLMDLKSERKEPEAQSLRDTSAIYQGWVLRKAVPLRKELSSWARIEKSRLPFSQDELARTVRIKNAQTTPVNEYDKLPFNNQRAQINRLVSDCNAIEEKSNITWALACIETVSLRHPRYNLRPPEIAMVHVILKKTYNHSSSRQVLAVPVEKLAADPNNPGFFPLQDPLPFIDPPLPPMPSLYRDFYTKSHSTSSSAYTESEHDQGPGFEDDHSTNDDRLIEVQSYSTSSSAYAKFEHDAKQKSRYHGLKDDNALAELESQRQDERDKINAWLVHLDTLPIGERIKSQMERDKIFPRLPNLYKTADRQRRATQILASMKKHEDDGEEWATESEETVYEAVDLCENDNAVTRRQAVDEIPKNREAECECMIGELASSDQNPSELSGQAQTPVEKQRDSLDDILENPRPLVSSDLISPLENKERVPKPDLGRGNDLTAFALQQEDNSDEKAKDHTSHSGLESPIEQCQSRNTSHIPIDKAIPCSTEKVETERPPLQERHAKEEGVVKGFKTRMMKRKNRKSLLLMEQQPRYQNVAMALTGSWPGQLNGLKISNDGKGGTKHAERKFADVAFCIYLAVKWRRAASRQSLFTKRGPEKVTDALRPKTDQVFGALKESTEICTKVLEVQRPQSGKLIKLKWICACGRKFEEVMEEFTPGAVQQLASDLSTPECSDIGLSSVSSSGSSSSETDLTSLGGSGKSQKAYCGPDDLAIDIDGSTEVGSSLQFARVQKFILLCLASKGQESLEHANVSFSKTDRCMYTELHRSYFAPMRRLMRTLTLRKLDRIEFTRFQLFNKDNVAIDTGDVGALPPDTVRDYEYDRKHPYRPLIPLTALKHWTENPSHVRSRPLHINRVPTKISGKLRWPEDDGGEIEGWGLRFKETVSWKAVWASEAFIGIVAAAFAIAWCSYRNGGLEDGFTVAGVVLAYGTIFLGLMQGFAQYLERNP